jgi:hypothetical protein
MDIKRLIEENMLIVGMALGGYVLTLILSLVNFQSVAAVFLKPILMSLFWAVIGIGIKFLLKSYIPELHEEIFRAATRVEIKEEKTKGNNLNVSVGRPGDEGDIRFEMQDEEGAPMRRAESGAVPPPPKKGASGTIEFTQDSKDMVKAVRTMIKREG